jgi:carbon-monoxide dehydrogenase medium subunit
MKCADFTYHRPKTIEEATAFLATLDDARLLAGGQSLVPMMNFRLAQPANVIDLNDVGDLDYVRVADGQLVVGAMTRQATLLSSELIGSHAPIVHDALCHVGHRQTRHRGTIGGSLAHFDPAAELCNLAILHDAEISLCSHTGTRQIPISEFGLGYLTTGINPDEILTEISWPLWPAGHGYAFEEFAMRQGDFAIVAVSALVTSDRFGRVARAAIAISGATPVPIRLTDVEAEFQGAEPSPELFRRAAIAAYAIEATSDGIVSADYRRHLARILTYRALEKACRFPQERLAHD